MFLLEISNFFYFTLGGELQKQDYKITDSCVSCQQIIVRSSEGDKGALHPANLPKPHTHTHTMLSKYAMTSGKTVFLNSNNIESPDPIIVLGSLPQNDQNPEI